MRAIQLIPTQSGLDGFQKSLHPCALDENSHNIGMVNLAEKALTHEAPQLRYKGLQGYSAIFLNLRLASQPIILAAKVMVK